MPSTDILFYVFAALTLLCGALVVANPFSRNPVTSAMFLVLTVASMAGLFVLLQAYFLAAIQILVYAGAVMVLFLFVIMLVNLDDAAHVREFNRQWMVALVAVAAVGAELGYFFHRGAASFHIAETVAAVPAAAGNTEALADSLFSEYLLPFEIASLVLLVAVVGSVIMAKKRI